MKGMTRMAVLAGILFLTNTVYANSIFEITFVPAFHPRSTVLVRRSGDRDTLTFGFMNLRTRSVQVEDHTLDKEAADGFFSSMNALSAKPPGEVRSIPETDGIDVQGKYTRPNAAPFVFDSLTPSKEYSQRDFAIVQALFKLLDRIKPSQALMEYMEAVRPYFEDLGLPVRVIGGYPYKVRFYGGLSSTDALKLGDLLKKLPANTPLVIDMSNLHTMDKALYPYFRDLIKQHKDIRWIATVMAGRQLLELGVKEENIEIK